MAENNAAVFTSKGQELLINCMKNSDTLTFTRICIGNGKYSSTSELVTATALKGEAQLSVPISSSLIRSDNSLCLTSYISNKNLKEGFRITEVGVFAKDSSDNEILYCICPIDEQYANFIPAFNGYAESKIVENIYVTVADASSTKVVVQDGIYATLDYVNKTFATKDEVNKNVNLLKFISVINCMTVNSVEELKNSTELDDLKSGLCRYIINTLKGSAFLVVTESEHSGMQSYDITQELQYDEHTYTRTAEMGIGIMHPTWSDWE